MVRSTIRRALAAFASVSAPLILLAGCGGSSGGSSGEAHGTTPARVGGRTVRTSAGPQVNEQAHARWRAGIALFQQFEQQGWNEERCNEASSKFDEATEAQDGKFAEAMFMAGLSLERCGHAERAMGFYRKALDVNPKFCKSRVAVGLAEWESGKKSEAARTFQAALKDDPQCKEAYVNIAIVQKAQGQAGAREALNNLRRALAIDASYLPAFNQMALLYLEQAQGNAQMLDLAAVVCRQAQQINKNYAPIYNTWGLINVKKGDIIEAARMFERSFTLDKRLFDPYMNFGQITLSFRGYDDARKAFEQAVALKPKSYDAHIGLGSALRGLKQYGPAEEQYNAAKQLDGGRAEAYFNLGVLHQDYKSGTVADLQQAKQSFNEFLSRVRSGQFASQVDDVKRTCNMQSESKGKGKRKRRPPKDCRPGRLQNIEMAIQALRAAGQS